MRDLGSAKAAVVASLVAVGCLLAALPVAAQEKPRHGGELIFLVPSEPPSYDAHREGTFGTVQPLAPFYNTLHQHRIIPHSSKVKGWTVTPSHYLNHQLDTVWLAE